MFFRILYSVLISISAIIASFSQQAILKVEKDSASILEIPTISLSQGVYMDGNIDKNLIFLEESSQPDILGGNVIIAGHSGYGDIAYFKNLYQLKEGDDIWLTYQEERYHYIVTSSYKVPKTGEIEMIRDSQKSTITLITCYGNNQQLVIIGEQKNNN